MLATTGNATRDLSLELQPKGFRVEMGISSSPRGEIFHYHGYPYDEHEVVTDDGYYLTMQRIPHGRDNPRSMSTSHEAEAQGSSMFCPHKCLKKCQSPLSSCSMAWHWREATGLPTCPTAAWASSSPMLATTSGSETDEGTAGYEITKSVTFTTRNTQLTGSVPLTVTPSASVDKLTPPRSHRGARTCQIPHPLSK
ncbi:hypothetical protein QYF61_015778 [Mycteria americana]|uniref:Partial AB-hydrolase lipase domain-containing protein n=1 Tax=Mycteria americana TaxID=33587 RepID=A0AAN7RYE7_MYCAM|nr:hypothetical protein QYF61_015778 [Mycteria americana]